MSNRREVVTINRRQFLTGTGGALLAIPLLPSLLEGEARAQATGRPKNLVVLSNSHGASWFSNTFPSSSTLTDSMSYAGRTIRRGALQPTVANGRTTLSPVLDAASTRLSPALLGKLNVIAGLDIINSGHQTGATLGNPWANDGTLGQSAAPYSIPTIDQVLAYSPSFYPSLGGVLRRSLEFGAEQGWGGLAFNWSNPTTRSGDIVPLHPSNDTLQAFNSVFIAPTTTPAPTRRPVVDLVFESFRRLTTSNRRISTSDRRRLDEHMTRIAEIQRRAMVHVDCSGITPPSRNADPYWVADPGASGANAKDAFQLINDVIVAAFLCGTCRIATVGALSHPMTLFSSFVGDWHQSIAHVASQGGTDAATLSAVNELKIAYQGVFEQAFLDLLTKLDVDNGAGGTVLDDSLVIWTQESGHSTHDGWSIPVVTGGSAGGAIKTGSYIDYRNMQVGTDDQRGGYHPGLMWNQFLGTVLQAMGVPRTEYEVAMYQPERPAGSGTGGYGWWRYDTADWAFQKPAHYEACYPVLGEMLPYLKA